MSAKTLSSQHESQASALELVPYEARLRDRWNECVRNARQSHPFFERDFIEYHGDRFHETSLILKKRGKFLAVLPLAKVGRVFHSYPGLPFGGWIALPQMTLQQFSTAFGLLADWMKQQQISSLIYNVTPPPYRKLAGEEDIYELERRGAKALRNKVTSLLKIGSRQSVNETVARLAKLAVRDGFVVNEDHPLSAVYQLACATLARRHQSLPLHQLREIEHISTCFPGMLKTIGVTWNGNLMAGVIFMLHENVLRLQYVGYHAHCPQGVSELMYVRLINDPRYQGHWLDFGTSMNPQSGDLINSLLSYKESYGARMNLLRSYEWTPGYD